jgi:hypothetical protein
MKTKEEMRAEARVKMHALMKEAGVKNAEQLEREFSEVRAAGDRVRQRINEAMRKR